MVVTEWRIRRSYNNDSRTPYAVYRRQTGWFGRNTGFECRYQCESEEEAQAFVSKYRGSHDTVILLYGEFDVDYSQGLL